MNIKMKCVIVVGVGMALGSASLVRAASFWGEGQRQIFQSTCASILDPSKGRTCVEIGQRNKQLFGDDGSFFEQMDGLCERSAGSDDSREKFQALIQCRDTLIQQSSAFELAHGRKENGDWHKNSLQECRRGNPTVEDYIQCQKRVLFSISNLARENAPTLKPTLEVFVGFSPSKASTELFEAAVLRELENDSFFARAGVEVKIHRRYATQEAVDALKNSRTLGFLWLGHPALDVRGEKLVNSYLTTPEKRYLPKLLFSASHSNLGFVGIVSCSLDDVVSRYNKYLPPTVPLFVPQTDDNRDIDPAAQFTYMIGGSLQVIEKIKNELKARVQAFQLGSSGQERYMSTLEVSYRDLLSKHFSYVVIANKHLAGVLEPTSELKIQITLPKAWVTSSQNTITIRPDDLNRTAPEGVTNFVDDILLTSLVSVSEFGRRDSLLSSPVHLGDDDGADWDSGLAGLSNPQNYRGYENLPPQFEFNGRFAP